MKSTQTIRMGMLAAIAATLLAAAPAPAALPAAATSCRSAIAKSYTKLVSTAVKTISACHKARDKGDPTLAAVDCNDLLNDAAHVDPKGKWIGAVATNTAAVTTGCPESVAPSLIQPSGAGEDYYTSCPVTCPGVPNPMTSMAQVGACLGCEAAAIADDALANALGSPTQGSQSPENQKCRGAIGKGYGMYLATFAKGATSCQTSQDKAGDNALTFCGLSANNDAKGKTAGALTKAADGLDKSCVGADLSTMASCAVDNMTNLKACNASDWGTASDDTFTTTYELPATICPSVIRTTIRGACSVNGDSAGDCSVGNATETELSVGWKGLAHGVDITDSYTLAGSVSCPGTEKGACGSCTVTGLSSDNPQYAAFTRCVTDPSIACTNPFHGDQACEGGVGQCQGGSNDSLSCTSNGNCPGGACEFGACRYFLGPPLSISAGGTPTCTLNAVNSDIQGSADPDDGTGNLTVDLRAIVYTGNSQSRPCPICRNDATPQDGVKAGTCLGGPQDGDPCDVQGFDLSFAPTDPTNPTAGPSLDCPPAIGANISGQGLAITLPLTTGTSTKSAEDPCESPNQGLSCFCGVCSGDNTQSCDKDADCAALSAGVCGRGNGVDRKPNNCTDGVCHDVGATDRGECAAADDDSYCSGVLFANGHGVIPCNTDSDCDTYISTDENQDKWVCQGNDCGTCSVVSPRSCFLNPILVTGTPGADNPTMVGTFCLPPSSNGSVNSATGSPGPGVVKIDEIIELRY